MNHALKNRKNRTVSRSKASFASNDYFHFSGLIIYLNCERMEESPQLHLIIACFV